MTHCSHTSHHQSGTCEPDQLGLRDFESRQQAAKDVRNRTRDEAADAFSTASPIVNGDQRYFQEEGLPGFASFTKALAHDSMGLVMPKSNETLLSAIAAGTQDAFECVELGGGKRLLSNPLNAYSYQLIGDDSNGGRIAPAPKFNSCNTAIDMAERYWMALCRDIRFEEYGHSELIKAACKDLNALGFEQEFGFVCLPQTIFRGAYNGCAIGPYVSQFLLQDFTFFNQSISQMKRCPKAGLDYLTELNGWKAANNGDCDPTGTDIIEGERHLTTLRDAGQLVHLNSQYRSILSAMMLLLEQSAQLSSQMPYKGDRITTSQALGSLGSPDIATHVGLASLYGLKHAWFQKWCVHRRLRPEAYAHRLELFRSGELSEGIASSEGFPFEQTLFTRCFGAGAEIWRRTTVLDRIFEHNKQQNQTQRRENREGSWLLPMAFPEGSPTHPAYPGGHAVSIAAAVTIAKAFFADTDFPNPKAPSEDGQRLNDYSGQSLTIHGELNKLIANVTLFRDGAGVNWRTDGAAPDMEARTGCHALELDIGGNLLGENVAISVLRDLKSTYQEVVGGFEFIGLSGNKIQI